VCTNPCVTQGTGREPWTRNEEEVKGIISDPVQKRFQMEPATFAKKDFCPFLKNIETWHCPLSTCGCKHLQTLSGAERGSIHRKIYPRK
jgi:hypothetical protein